MNGNGDYLTAQILDRNSLFKHLLTSVYLIAGQFKFKIKSFKVSGSLLVENNYVLIKGDIPFLAAPFKGTIEETIKTKATELLGVK
jgi:hypothetical protein